MRLLLFILTILTTSVTAQINAYNIRIGSDKSQDSIYCLLTATTGSNFAGRGEFKNMAQLADILDGYIAAQQNIANANLTFTGDRTHNTGGNDLEFTNLANGRFRLDKGTSHDVAYFNYVHDTLQILQDGTGNSFSQIQMITSGDGSIFGVTLDDGADEASISLGISTAIINNGTSNISLDAGDILLTSPTGSYEFVTSPPSGAVTDSILTINAAGAIRKRSITANCVNVADYGILPDGTDQTTDINTMLSAVYTAGGGCIEFNEGTYRIDGLIRLPNSGGALPTQPALRISGTAAHKASTGTFSPSGGTILDLRYGGADSARIMTTGVGALTLENITFQSVNASVSIPFIWTTNTVLNVRNCGFFGRNGVSAADETAIVLGAQTGTPVIDGTDDAPFQGYGTIIEDNWFNQIERGVHGQTYANAITIKDNTWWNRCGGECAVEFEGGASSCDGNVIIGNLFEVVGYDYGIKITTGSKNTIAHNNFYDIGTNTTLVYFGPDAQFNMLIEGMNSGFTPSYIDTEENNTVITSEQAIQSTFPQGIISRGQLDIYNQGIGERVHHPSNGRYFYNEIDGLGFQSAVYDAGNLYLYKVQRASSASHMSLMGSDNNRFAFTDGGVYMSSSTGSPEGVKSAPVGSMYLRSDGGAGTTLYIKESGTGNTGWVAK